MQIFVKTPSNRTITLEVEPSHTIEDITKMLEDDIQRKGYTTDTIHLIFAGKNVSDRSRRVAKVVVVEGSSRSEGGVRQVNLDQPLLLFYHKVFKTNYARACPISTLDDDDEAVRVGGVKIKFHRTVRVPDNDKTHALPATLGHFKLFNVGQFADSLPPSILRKGGVFLSMYQREAMWMSFEPGLTNSFEPHYAKSYAVKISVGGVNALTGLPQNQTVEGKQDYIVVGGDNGQRWLVCVTSLFSPPTMKNLLPMIHAPAGWNIHGFKFSPPLAHLHQRKFTLIIHAN